jgi:hypothetical protein
MIWIILLSILAGILGRMGGVGKPFSTKMRDLGVPLCLTIALLVLRVDCPWWALLIAFGAVFGACTTYLDSIFGYDNFWASGALVGLASFPVTLFTGHWWLFAARAVLLAVIWGSLNRWLPERVLLWRRDTVEEFCRYAVVVGSCFLLK